MATLKNKKPLSYALLGLSGGFLTVLAVIVYFASRESTLKVKGPVDVIVLISESSKDSVNIIDNSDISVHRFFKNTHIIGSPDAKYRSRVLAEFRQLEHITTDSSCLIIETDDELQSVNASNGARVILRGEGRIDTVKSDKAKISLNGINANHVEGIVEETGKIGCE